MGAVGFGVQANGGGGEPLGGVAGDLGAFGGVFGQVGGNHQVGDRTGGTQGDGLDVELVAPADDPAGAAGAGRVGRCRAGDRTGGVAGGILKVDHGQATRCRMESRCLKSSGRQADSARLSSGTCDASPTCVYQLWVDSNRCSGQSAGRVYDAGPLSYIAAPWCPLMPDPRATAVSAGPVSAGPCRPLYPPSVRTFCTVSRRPAGPLAPPTRRARRCSRWRSRSGGANAGRLARKAKYGRGPRSTQADQGRSGFDKGTLAMAHIGPMRAGQKPAQSANKRTGHRPLSNPPLCRRETDTAAANTAVTLKRQCHWQSVPGSVPADVYQQQSRIKTRRVAAIRSIKHEWPGRAHHILAKRQHPKYLDSLWLGCVRLAVSL